MIQSSVRKLYEPLKPSGIEGGYPTLSGRTIKKKFMWSSSLIRMLILFSARASRVFDQLVPQRLQALLRLHRQHRLRLGRPHWRMWLQVEEHLKLSFFYFNVFFFAFTNCLGGGRVDGLLFHATFFQPYPALKCCDFFVMLHFFGNKNFELIKR